MNIQNIFKSYKTLLGFMVLCIFIQLLLGDSVLYGFLWLVLLSMIMINIDDFTALLKNVT